MNSRSDSFPEITTPRCTLRNIVSTDQQKVFEGLSHPEVTRYYGVSYDSLEATGAQMTFYQDLLQSGTGIWWAVRLEDGGGFAGACGFNNWVREHRRAEIGFWLLPAFQGSGLMNESASAILGYGFGVMKLHRVEAIVETGNNKSAALLSKLGFVHEGIRRECEIKGGRFIDLSYYALLEKNS